MPLSSLLGSGVFVFRFFFAGNVASLKTQISKQIRKPKYLAKNNKKQEQQKKKTLVRGSAGAHEVRVQNFTVLISRKRRGHLDSEGIWGVVLGTSLWCYSCGLRNTFFVDKSPCYSKMSVVGLILTRQGLFIRRILVSV